VLRTVRPRLTYANVTATLALFVALGGGAYAAATLPRNSVGTRQLKRGAVTTAKLHKRAVTNSKLRKNAVTSSKVRNNSLTGSDINESTLGAVPSAAIATGLAHVTYKAVSGVAPAGDVGTATATCDAGQHALGGGAKVDDVINSFILDDFPTAGGTGWTTRVGNGSTGNTAFTAYAVCAPVSTTG
jgi:hypothetical protein